MIQSEISLPMISPSMKKQLNFLDSKPIMAKNLLHDDSIVVEPDVKQPETELRRKILNE